MRFGTTRSQIYDAQKTARVRWDATEAEWDDAVSGALRAIDQLTTLFVQIRQECEFPGS